MSFGFSIGDFVMVIDLANKVRKEFVGAPRQFKDISDEVRSLSIVLQDVEVVLLEREPNSQEKRHLEDIMKGCWNTLEELEKILDKYSELDSRPKSVSKRVKRAWKRLMWEPDDIRELRSRISSNITLLNAFSGKFTREIIAKLVQHQDDQQHRMVLDWLTPANYAAQQSDCIKRRQAGTGQWLLDSAKFKAWVESEEQTLFCPGIPGAGKTILTSIVIEYLHDKFRKADAQGDNQNGDSDIGIAYLYCNFKRQHEQQAEDLLASLLKQLTQIRTSLPDGLKSLYNEHKCKGTRMSLDEISRTLQSVAAMYSRVFIIVDALDECQATGHCRTRFLTEIFDLQAKCGVNIFATSRFIPEVIEKFGDSISLEIRASEQDVQKYIDGHISHLPSFVRCRPDLQEEIKTAIINAVDGMFLLAQLHITSLIGKRSPKAVRTALTKLPTGSEAYDYAYKDAMERIEGQVADQKELAKQILLWITCAKRSLTTTELQHALGIEVGKSELDEDNLPQIDDMISVCAGLVTVDEQSGVIRLVHYTTQEYFQRTQKHWFPQAELEITISCVTYLSFDVFSGGFCETDGAFEKRTCIYQLYDYAAHNWGHHAREASSFCQNIMEFLECEEKVEASSQALMAVKHLPFDRDYSQRVPRQMAGLHLAAYFGVKGAVQVLLGGNDPDLKDSYNRTPLWYAAMNGHGTVVQLLINKGANIESMDSPHSQTPLSIVIEHGNEDIVKLLLNNRADIESKTKTGETPLITAAANGHEAIVKLLLAKGANIESMDNQHSQTPLSIVIEHGIEDIVKLLLNNRADIESKTKTGETPLITVAANGHETVVKLLLAKGANLKSKDVVGQTSLLLTAESEDEAAVKLLIENNADRESKDNSGHTPLLCAAGWGHEAVVKLLLALDSVNPNGTESTGRTPLSYAAMRGHNTVVMALLSNKCVDPDFRDHYGSTPLSIATRHCRIGVVKLLLATGCVDFDSRDCFGRTPLWWARRRRNADIVQLFLESAENGAISVYDDGTSISADLTFNSGTRRYCDICTLSILEGNFYYRCAVCHGGDFDICLECYKIGGRCLDDAHKLVEKKDFNEEESE